MAKARRASWKPVYPDPSRVGAIRALNIYLAEPEVAWVQKYLICLLPVPRFVVGLGEFNDDICTVTSGPPYICDAEKHAGLCLIPGITIIVGLAACCCVSDRIKNVHLCLMVKHFPLIKSI